MKMRFNNQSALTMLWLAVFGLGLLIRIYDLTDLPLDFHSTRQMHSLIVARAIHTRMLPADALPQWQREIAIERSEANLIIEPPLVEALAAVAYRLVGAEVIWIPRLFSILFWMAGSLAVWLIARKLSGSIGAGIALAYFLILPYGALASRAFQPDPLMVCLLCYAIWAICKWEEKRSWKWALIAGALGGMTILVKVLSGFFLAGAWLGILTTHREWRKAVRNRQLWTAAALTLLPYLLYHVYGMYIAGFLQGQYSARFFPSMWMDPVFYLRWKGMIDSTVGFVWFLIALLGLFTLKDRVYRGLMLAMLAAYFLYGLLVPYHITTHDYYQEPLILLVAVGLAAALVGILQLMQGPKILLRGVALALLLFTVVVQAWDVRVSLKAVDYRSEAEFWRELGEVIGHDRQVVGLTHDYGNRLAYWGWVDSTEWLSAADFRYRQLAGQELDTQTLFAEQIQGKDVFVVTLMGELDHQPELRSLLFQGYAIEAQTDEYVIFDLQQPLR